MLREDKFEDKLEIINALITESRKDLAAKQAWSVSVTKIIEQLAETQKRFTADDVWAASDSKTPVDPRRLGARLQDAARRNLIRKGPLERSQRWQRHKAPVQVWLSNKNMPILPPTTMDLQIALDAILTEARVAGFRISARWMDRFEGRQVATMDYDYDMKVWEAK